MEGLEREIAIDSPLADFASVKFASVDEFGPNAGQIFSIGKLLCDDDHHQIFKL